MKSPGHIPVLQDAVVRAFAGCELEYFIDGTTGAGGHASLILAQHEELKLLLGIDQDPAAHLLAQHNLAAFEDRFQLVLGNFRNLKEHSRHLPRVDGILLDLGISSMQLDQASRGFSFMQEGPLDMRMNTEAPLTAADWLANCSEEELSHVLHTYGDIPQSRRVARQLLAHRPFTTTSQLAEFCVANLPYNRRIHPATLVFQAIRIALNDELTALEQGLWQAIDRLRPGGRLAVISFHSLEDRIVKQTFAQANREWTADPTDLYSGRKKCDRLVKLLSKKPLQPCREEMRSNPRSRSARLRWIERL